MNVILYFLCGLLTVAFYAVFITTYEYEDKTPAFENCFRQMLFLTIVENISFWVMVIFLWPVIFALILCISIKDELKEKGSKHE